MLIPQKSEIKLQNKRKREGGSKIKFKLEQNKATKHLELQIKTNASDLTHKIRTRTKNKRTNIITT